MKAVPKLSTIVRQIAHRHGVDLDRPGAYLRLTLAGHGQLVIENIGAGRVSVANYIEVGNDQVADPQIVVYTRVSQVSSGPDMGEAAWVPIEFTELFGGEKLTGYLHAAENGRFGEIPFAASAIPLLFMIGAFGKSAQFPLHTWLPDAMEGPTPVSALVHSATMVAAGVFLVGRVYPIFTPEALLVIAVIGCTTLFIAATIAITATDIKRVLAYSTVSQLGYMMLALGLGGWVAGLFHLITHAFFKSLLFLCSGSVIHAVHSNEMTVMGGLRRKMPITAYTMLIGCLAIAGAGIPPVIGLSGFHSKDVIIEQALSYLNHNSASWFVWLLFLTPALGAGITAFYMFRLWYLTFTGEPRDPHRYDHAHESPWVMTGPLVLLAVFAIGIGWTLPFTNLSVTNLLEQARTVGTQATATGTLMPDLVVPNEHLSHAWPIKLPAGIIAFLMALIGFLLATIVYLWKLVSADTLRRSLQPLYSLTWHKWWFDELYDAVFVRPTHWISGFIARVLDRGLIDGIVHLSAYVTRAFALVVSIFGDRFVIDNTVDGVAARTWDLGLSLRSVQTGRLRQYVMFIVVGTVVLFVIASVWRYASAG